MPSKAIETYKIGILISGEDSLGIFLYAYVPAIKRKIKTDKTVRLRINAASITGAIIVNLALYLSLPRQVQHAVPK